MLTYGWNYSFQMHLIHLNFLSTFNHLNNSTKFIHYFLLGKKMKNAKGLAQRRYPYFEHCIVTYVVRLSAITDIFLSNR